MKKQLYTIKNFIVSFNLSDSYSRAAEMSFYLTLSIFPSLIFIICALAYIPNVNVVATSKTIRAIMPEDAHQIVSYFINSAVTHKSINLLIISAIFAVWTFSKAVNSVIHAQNQFYGFSEKRNPIMTKLISIVFALLFFIEIIFCIVFLVYGTRITSFLDYVFDNNIIITSLFTLVRFIVPIFFMVTIFLNIYSFGPAKRIPYIQCLPGAIITSILWLIFSMLYSIYANNFFNGQLIYGSISTMIILMTWLYFCSLSVSVGYKINALLYFAKNEKAKRVV